MDAINTPATNPSDSEYDLRTHLLAVYGKFPYSSVPEDPMTAPSTRSERFDARLSTADKRLLDRAAELTGRSLSEFVLGSAREAARRTIERYEVMALTDPRDQAAFVGALLNPPAPNRRLRQAMQRHRRATGK
ncbi:MAG: DUF1778 domain-containing protein [Gammaproteobacteria bacterium]|nr:DUF1778 domain-containing protein [Gammaproteobacteria bacterium]